jgi:predicted MPP superfamily phosphohydrolase
VAQRGSAVTFAGPRASTNKGSETIRMIATKPRTQQSNRGHSLQLQTRPYPPTPTPSPTDDPPSAELETFPEEAIYVGVRGWRRRHVESDPDGGFFALLPKFPPLRWYAEHFAPRHLRCEQVAVPIAGLPRGLDGLRIGFLTDIHYDLGRPLTMLARGVDLLNAAAPDLILLGGDYVVDRTAGFAACAELLGHLHAPLGVYGILGNHDYHENGDLIAAQLAAAGPIVLRNEALRLTAPGSAPFWVIGLDDALRGQADLSLALAGVPADEFRLFLAHEPDVADHLGGQRVGLQLSGHSHGGQVVLPGFGPPLLPTLGRRYLRGLCQTPTHPVYTSRGLGAVPPYVRFNCPPEVTVLTLTPGA